ncbi:MAG: preprotein translocase subunit SecY [Promethearchaeota archaeon]
MAGKFIRFFAPFVRIMPEVKQPQREVSFKEKLIWTALVLVIYIIMSNIDLYKPSGPIIVGSDPVYWMRIILASNRGKLTELGIGPIVTAGLIMQLVLGAKLIKVDMSDPYDRSMFSGAQKVMSLFMTILTAIMYLIGGQFGELTFQDGIIIFMQLMLSGLVIILLDEILQKGWGLGSGVSLFIAAGVAGQIFWNLFNFIEVQEGIPQGIVIAMVSVFIDNDPNTNFTDILIRPDYPNILGLITTFIIFLFVIWFESTKVEIPLQYAGYRGFKGKYPMKLLYVSNIPVILVNALYANFLFIGQWLLADNGLLRGGAIDPFWLNLIGQFEVQGTGSTARLVPIKGLIYFLSPPNGLDALFADPLRAIVYLSVFILLCIGLGRVWVSVSGIGPKEVSQQIIDSGMQVPGFRRSEKIIEKILKRYIPTLIVLNGIIIAILSFTADSLGALTSGTGLLIAIGIVHQYAETISKEVAAMQYPSMRGFLGLD